MAPVRSNSATGHANSLENILIGKKKVTPKVNVKKTPKSVKLSAKTPKLASPADPNDPDASKSMDATGLTEATEATKPPEYTVKPVRVNLHKIDSRRYTKDKEDQAAIESDSFNNNLVIDEGLADDNNRPALHIQKKRRTKNK